MKYPGYQVERKLTSSLSRAAPFLQRIGRLYTGYLTRNVKQVYRWITLETNSKYIEVMKPRRIFNKSLFFERSQLPRQFGYFSVPRKGNYSNVPNKCALSLITLNKSYTSVTELFICSHHRDLETNSWVSLHYIFVSREAHRLVWVPNLPLSLLQYKQKLTKHLN